MTMLTVNSALAGRGRQVAVAVAAIVCVAACNGATIPSAATLIIKNDRADTISSISQRLCSDTATPPVMLIPARDRILPSAERVVDVSPSCYDLAFMIRRNDHDSVVDVRPHLDLQRADTLILNLKKPATPPATPPATSAGAGG